MCIVIADQRRKGVAIALFAEFEAKALEFGYNRIHLTTGKCMVPACRLYERAGFVLVEECMTADDYPYCRYVKAISK